jgi:general secretion pathway protein I
MRQDIQSTANSQLTQHAARAGFTLLEVLVATLIMGIAVSGVLSGIAGAARNAARLTEYDRANVLAKQKMDELLMDRAAPRNQTLAGDFDPVVTGVRSGWIASVAPFESLTGGGPGAWGVDRVQVEIWWMNGQTRRSFALEGYRRGVLQVGDRKF